MSRVTEGCLDRARTLAEQAPEGRGVLARATRRSFPEGAVAWATQGPERLVRLLEAVREKEEKATRMRAATGGLDRKRKALAEKLLSEVRTYKPPASLTKVVGEALKADADPEQISAASAIVSALRERQHRQDEYESLEKSIEAAPKDLATARGGLERSLEKAVADLHEAKRGLATLQSAAMQRSAEAEQVELDLAGSVRKLRTLQDEARLITAHVEEKRPVEARRLYHLFREAAYHRQYKRDAEEAEELRAQAEAALELKSADYNQITEQYNKLVDGYNEIDRQLHDSRDLEGQLRADLRWSVDRHTELEDTVASLQQMCEETAARGTPISRIPRASAVRALAEANLFTFGKLADSTEEELRAISGIGEAAIAEIKRNLNEVGLWLREW